MRITDLLTDRLTGALHRGVKTGIGGALGCIPREAWVAVAAMSATLGVLPWTAPREGEPLQPPTPEQWAAHIVRHAEALEKAARAWVSRP
jgi:hypothetical protein